MDLLGLCLEGIVKEDLVRNKFVISITFMHGDADLYTEVDLVAETRDALNDFYAVADTYFAWGWNERIEKVDEKALNKMPEYWIFTSADSKEEYATDEHPDWWEDAWPCDKTNDCWGRCLMNGYKVHYFNNDGIEFLVTRAE